MQSMDLYLAEYAKSSKAKCRSCRKKIKEGSLRMAEMVQSAFRDAKEPNWYHPTCFFKEKSPASESDISGFGSLLIKDQNYIFDEIAKLTQRVPLQQDPLKYFCVEYSKSSQAMCKGCKTRIAKAVPRIKKIERGNALWYHVDCFEKNRETLKFFTSGEQISGFKSLSKEDMALITKALPAMKGYEVVPVDESKKSLQETLQKQNEKFFQLIDILKESSINKNELEEILTFNKQDRQTGKDASLNLVCDILTFGALARCAECNGQLVFCDTGYKCTGHLSEWQRCQHFEEHPPRFKAEIPIHIAVNYNLQNFVTKVEDRVVCNTSAQAIANDEAVGQEAAHEAVHIEQLMNMSAIDPALKLQHVSRVYKENGKYWACVLTKIDVNTKQNSYYKFQLLEGDNPEQYCLFRAWGRIGTTIGYKKTSFYANLETAKEKFQARYLSMTGNNWGMRDTFVKYAGKYYEMDIECDDSNTDKLSMESTIPSKLKPQVQNLLKLIFDID
ncbi:poly [ADP-ribose] polymerase-like [Lutzomyia longipalpis]|uniref:poly [ADP-ribose] polymerase-like n=1 Tax=Lutzomyia longipalpis TaxID=7200 RepID=UPI0024840935|nr:poly [ADP-ribose] polymerase-like [Lutzomyia longipalpis]